MCKSAIAHCTHVSECFLNSHVQPHIARVCTHLRNSPVVCVDCGFWPCSLPSPFDYLVKLNLHEKDLLIWYISHHLHHGIVPVHIYDDFHRFTGNLQHQNANFLKICANLQKSWNNMISNDGLIIEYIKLEYMNRSHIHLAVLTQGS